MTATLGQRTAPALEAEWQVLHAVVPAGFWLAVAVGVVTLVVGRYGRRDSTQAS